MKLNLKGRTVVRFALAVGVCLFALTAVAPLFAHHVEGRYIHPIPWQKPHFSRITGMGYSLLGLDIVYPHTDMQTIEGKSCVVGNLVAFDVDDKYAFDIDEPVDLTLTYATAQTTAGLLQVVWDKNGGIGLGALSIINTPGSPFRTVTVTLDRARFSGQGSQHVDLAVGTYELGKQMALCDVAIERSGKTKVPNPPGKVRIEVKDGSTGALIPARVGLYDSTGRIPLPSDQAVLVERFADKVRLLNLSPRGFWPSTNRVGFYVNGTYEADVPSGIYEVAATHGPEFRAYHENIEVKAGRTTKVSITLQRYVNMPAQGWYSGDGHIHLARDVVADMPVWTMLAAEDLHLTNLLQMGNINGIYFEQPAWGKAGRFEQNGWGVASGQEDPRTGQLGHTIHQNLQAPIHQDSEHYFEYSNVFDETHRQGGISGYAHLNAPWFNAGRGLALDVPFGAVDFVEILQCGRLRVDDWYDFLNLGFKLVPSAGSDFPYIDLPGVVRNYTKIQGGYSADAWYASFHAGRGYVTNGPFLEFSVNGHPIGDEIHVARGTKLNIVAKAQLNPDVDKLDRLEVVALGDVVATETARGRDHAQLDFQITADRSMWIAARAYGARNEQAENAFAPQMDVIEEWNTTAAHTDAIYVVVDNKPILKTEAVPHIIAHEREELEEILSAPLVPSDDLENWETGKTLVEQWPKQLLLLQPRIEKADAIYQAILDKAKAQGSH